MNKYICIHGHFYQPPRENPWLEEVELQDSAYPYHDWNSRISAECYAPNTASRILNAERKIVAIVNNYAKISFNFGPTLLSWMERNDPDIYQALLDADKKSQEYFSGHGSALAQVYNHIIMPLAHPRDKETQIIWGIEDFKKRFNRMPEGMWLAETAVDLESLEILVKHGIKFTILAPRQAHRVRGFEDKRWKNVKDGKVDPKMPYQCTLPSGKTIAIFFYDGPISQDIAFAGLLQSGETLSARLMSAFNTHSQNPQLIHIATDGETYGHHHRHGDMALAYCLYHIEANNLANITIYGEYLEKFPPTHEVEIFERSSWSCVHGVERWYTNCGCNSGGNYGWNQEWRAPLRGALDWLRDNIVKIYEDQIGPLVKNPWDARNAFVHVLLNRCQEQIEQFFAEHAQRPLTKEEKIKVLKLMEMQRHAMYMYTSCGWFFDELSGIETVQIIQYAARAIQLVQDVSQVSLEESFKNLLERAPSNIEHFKNGSVIYEMFVKPAVIDLPRVAVHYAISSLFKEYGEQTAIYTYNLQQEHYEHVEVGKQQLAIGRIRVFSTITHEETILQFAVVHLGGHNIIGGVVPYKNEETFNDMGKSLKESFMKSQIPELIHGMDEYYKNNSYSLWHLFREEQKTLLEDIFRETSKEIATRFRQIYEQYYPVIRAVESMNIDIPRDFRTVIEFVLNNDLQDCLKAETMDFAKIEHIVKEVSRWGLIIDKATIKFIAESKIEDCVTEWAEDAEDISKIDYIIKFLRIVKKLKLDLNIWQAQNKYFAIGNILLQRMKHRETQTDADAVKWLAHFKDCGDVLEVRME